MNTIKVINELSPEDRKLLEGLTGSISLLASVIGSTLTKAEQERTIALATEPTITPLSDDAVDDSHPPLKVPNEADAYVEDLTPTEEPVAEPVPEVKPVSLAEFQKAVTLAVSKGADAKTAVKTIINKYATSVSAVPEDKRAEVMAELSKI